MATDLQIEVGSEGYISESHDSCSHSGTAHIGEGPLLQTPSGRTPKTPAKTSQPSTPRGHPELSDHQLYQRLRLKLVQLFGSLAASLFELGAEAETGRISRRQFEDMTSTRLNILTQSEANLLFSHITSQDVLRGGHGTHASYKDFSITEDEWCQVVSAKMGSGGSSSLPFQSGPSGASMGLYHRSIHVDTVHEERVPSKPLASKDKGKSGAGHDAATAATNRRQRKADPAPSTQPPPWQQRQRQWAPSALSGDGPALQAKDLVSRGRPYQHTLRMAQEGERLIDRPRHALLGTASRGLYLPEGDNNTFLVPDCPTRRIEMRPQHCMSQADEFWPYSTPRRTPRLAAARKSLLSARSAF